MWHAAWALRLWQKHFAGNFGRALDEQSREQVGEELSALVASAGKTIVFVTHSISEAIFLSDEIYVLGPRPGHIRARFQVEEPQPRRASFYVSPAFAELRNSLFLPYCASSSHCLLSRSIRAIAAEGPQEPAV